MTEDASLSILGRADWPLGAHILSEKNEGYPRGVARGCSGRRPRGETPGCLMNGGMCARLSC